MSSADVLAGLCAYALGSIPTAQLLVRWFARKDLSASGSANVGALNAMRVSKSRWLGIGVMVFDALKGAAAVFAARALDAHDGAGLVGVVAGHNYNFWLSLSHRRLAGGKGFAAGAGSLLCFMPWLVAVWFCVGLMAWLGFKLWRGISDEAPASLVATLALVPAAYVLYGGADPIAMGLTVALILPKLVPEVRVLLSGPPEDTPIR